jgi:class 3 adenylate cyclase
MTFDEVLAQVIALLQRERRVSYRALKRRFDLDDEYLEDLKAELIHAKKLASDEDGTVIVWLDQEEAAKRENGEKENKGLASSVQSLESKDPSPASSPRTLDARLSDSRPDAAERRQLTVMFCDLVGSTALSARTRSRRLA